MIDTSNLAIELERYDYEYLLEQALAKVPDDIDKREGSIIYDALAPACYELAEMYMQLKLMYFATFISTAYDQYLDLKVAEQGLRRFPATKAVKLGYFEDSDGQPMSIPVGARFSTIEVANIINYVVIGEYGQPGQHRLECETTGTVGNDYLGDLLPITHINGLGKAELSTLLVPGQNTETDDELRTRFFNAVNERAFGGNVIQYRQEILNIDGVGAVQVYPVWAGGGTVKCSILDSAYNPISSSFIATIQELIDPESGEGIGLAPIGHKVTIATATIKSIRVEIHIDYLPGWTQSQLEEELKQAVEDYFLSLRQSWDNRDSLNRYALTIFRSQIMASILRVEGVANVSEVLLDSKSDDIELIQSGQLQELPMVSEVVMIEN